MGVFLSINLSFFSNDALNRMLQWCDNVRENTQSEEHKQSETVVEDDFSGQCEYSTPIEESEKQTTSKASTKPAPSSANAIKDTLKETPVCKVVKEQTSSADEMKRILNCFDHYEALGFPRHKKIDLVLLKKEYRKKVYF